MNYDSNEKKKVFLVRFIYFLMVSIYKIFILQRESGLCLVDATIDPFPEENLEQNGMLVSGLITSFMHFTNEILGEEIRLFETNSYRLVFTINNDVMFVVLMDRKGPVKFAENILKRLSSRFSKKFQDEINRSLSGDITAFTEITRDIESITQLRNIKLIRHYMKQESIQHTENFKKTIHNLLEKTRKR